MYNTIDNERKNNIIESLKEYHEENASIIYDIFERFKDEIDFTRLTNLIKNQEYIMLLVVRCLYW